MVSRFRRFFGPYPNMPATLLRTKLNLPPPRSGLVLRPRLVEQLDAGLHGRLTLVCAPAGFGKTTLISAWLVASDMASDKFGVLNDECPDSGIHHSALRIHEVPQQSGVDRSRVAWLSLDKGDDYPQRFLSYLTAAVQQADSSLGADAWAMLQSGQPPTFEQVLTSLINDLALTPGRLLLVLDDYHVITAQAVHDALNFLVEHQPASLHLVIASRADPPLPLARMRARNDVNEIRARDLRFTGGEAAGFLRHTMGLDLSDTEVALLDRRTEGWIAGLQLAAHSLLHQENRQDFLTDFAGDDRFVADYLIEEVLATQAAVVQDFLLQSAILDNLTASLCDAVTGQSDSQAILTSLEHANLFIVPLDNRRQWYRYHQLFADLLRERLSESGRSVAALHTRASRWYAENGFHALAIDHALEAGDPAEAVRLIEETVAVFFIGSELTTLTRWWPRLPAELIARHPRLAMAYAWAFLATGQPAHAEACLQSVEQAIGSPMTALVGTPVMVTFLPDPVAAALAEVTIIRINLAMGELDLARASQLAQAVLPYLEIDPEVFLFNRPADLHTVVKFTSGLVQLHTGKLDAAAVSLHDAWRLARSQGHAHLAALAVGNLASLQLTRGQLRQTEETCERGAHEVAEMAWSRSPMTGVIYAHWGTACYARNNLVAAHTHYLEAIRLAEPWGNWEALQPSYLGLSRLYRAEGDWPGAFEALDNLERHATGAMTSAQPQVEAIRSLYLAERGDPSRLNRWVEHHEGDFDGASLPVQEEASILLARMLFAHGDVERASMLVGSLSAGAEAGGRWGRALEILVLQALLHAAEVSPKLAQAALSKALRLAEAQGAIRPFVDAGQPMAELLTLALRSGVSTAMCRRLLAAFPGRPQIRPESADRSPKSSAIATDGDFVLVEPLTEREIEVLVLLAQGHSNKTIARKLVLTEGTVKAHAHNIYAKLAVSTRGEAVARARTLGILV